MGLASFAFIIASVLLLLVVIVAIVGLLLPERYVTKPVELTIPPDSSLENVWAALDRVRTSPMSGSMCRGIAKIRRHTDDHPLEWTEDMGSSVASVRELERSLVGRHGTIVREMSDSVVPLTCIYELHVTDTSLSGKASFRVRRGTWHVPLLRVAVRLTGQRGVRNYLSSVVRNASQDGVSAAHDRDS